MKHVIIRLTAVVMAATMLCGCVIKKGESESDRDRFALKTFGYTNLSLAEYLRIMSLAQIVNRYIEADEAERQAIDERYFPTMKIRQDDNGIWCLRRSGEVLYSFSCDGSLNTSGSRWEASANSDPFVTSNNKIKIDCLAEGKWQIDIINVVSYPFIGSGSYEITGGTEIYDADLEYQPIFEYEISGSGYIEQRASLTSGEYFKVEFNIVEPLAYRADGGFVEGKSQIEVTDGTGAKPVPDFTANLTGGTASIQYSIHNTAVR